MIPQYTDTQFTDAKSTDMLSCECEFCHNNFLTLKKNITQELKSNRGRVRFCNKICHANNSKHSTNISHLTCDECKTQFTRKSSQLKPHKIYNTYFCSRQCFNTFLGRHRKHPLKNKIPKPDKIINGITIPQQKSKATLRNSLYRQIGYNEAKNANNLFMHLFWGLYWGEGTKGKEQVHLANMDLAIIKIFIKGMMDFYAVPKEKFTIRIAYHTHANYSYDEIIQYWLTNLNLSVDQVRKGTCKSNYYPNTKIQSHYGVCNIRVNSTELIHRILGAIDYLKDSQLIPQTTSMLHQ